MKRNSVELQVLVRGKPVTEYIHQRKAFIEGREGSEFELRVKNNLGQRVLIVPSVDGLSVMDGQEASSQSQGYVLSPWQEMLIPGWRLDNDGVARFIFEDMKASYAEQVGKGSNRGVIGLKAFAEKVVYRRAPDPFPIWVQPEPWQPRPIIWTTDNTIYHYDGHQLIGSNTTVYGASSGTKTAVDGDTLSLKSSGGVSANCSSTPTMGESTIQNCSAEVKTRSAVRKKVSVNFVQEAEPAEDIGVGFGEAAEHKVQEVTFNRGRSVATFAIYYDSRKGLEKRGITVVSNQKPLPEPFPASACTPPQGWAETHSR